VVGVVFDFRDAFFLLHRVGGFAAHGHAAEQVLRSSIMRRATQKVSSRDCCDWFSRASAVKAWPMWQR